MNKNYNDSDLQNVIVGLGITGLSVVQYLHALGEQMVVMDSRAQPLQLQQLQQQYPTIPTILGGLDERVLKQARRIIVSPGVSLQEPELLAAAASGVEIIGDVTLFARENKVPVIAITGSNGKTTVTSWVGQCLRAAGLRVAVCGNIGEPVLATLSQSALDFIVLELSSFQLETVQSLHPQVSVCLNITPDHLDRHASMEAYRAAKLRIYEHATVAVVNADEDDIASFIAKHPQQVTFSATGVAADVHLQVNNSGEKQINYGGDGGLSLASVASNAGHHALNLLATIAILRALQIDIAPLHAVLQSLSGLPHRCQWVAQIAGVDYVNDSKATNVGAAIAGIASVAENNQVVLIAGGQAKGADMSLLAPMVAKRCRAAVLLGEDAEVLRGALQETGVPIELVDSLQVAVARAAALANQGDVVLLSPACASWDMFRDYQARGEEFIHAVQSLSADKGEEL